MDWAETKGTVELNSAEQLLNFSAGEEKEIERVRCVHHCFRDFAPCFGSICQLCDLVLML